MNETDLRRTDTGRSADTTSDSSTAGPHGGASLCVWTENSFLRRTGRMQILRLQATISRAESYWHAALYIIDSDPAHLDLILLNILDPTRRTRSQSKGYGRRDRLSVASSAEGSNHADAGAQARRAYPQRTTTTRRRSDGRSVREHDDSSNACQDESTKETRQTSHGPDGDRPATHEASRPHSRGNGRRGDGR
jgi:hypothetical protein